MDEIPENVPEAGQSRYFFVMLVSGFPLAVPLGDRETG